MRGFVRVDAAAIADDAELARWIDAAAGYAAWLAPTGGTGRSTSISMR